ncbi:TatD family hydrolase [Micromonospora sp. NPDC050200]|uniref:TatD family hydrolase n=1 Tax=Micromonospora sp. NPDC050200 TaxID=3155664 RepID=UPI0033DC84C4
MSQALSLPRLDCHAHVAPDVTRAQITALDGAFIFAMTRSPAEARAAARRSDDTIMWGYGAHPGVKTSLAAVTVEDVRAATQLHVLIGEVGLDRSTALQPQQVVLDSILEGCRQQPVLISLHSTGRTADLLGALERQPHAGAILHWFNGTASEIQRAADVGCYFSVNAAMTDEGLTLIPLDRILPETDFPSSRRSTKAKIPGDIDFLEARLAALHNTSPAEIRQVFYRNLAALTQRSGTRHRLPPALQQALATAS